MVAISHQKSRVLRIRRSESVLLHPLGGSNNNFEKKQCYKKRGADICWKSNCANFYLKLRQDFNDSGLYKVLNFGKITKSSK